MLPVRRCASSPHGHSGDIDALRAPIATRFAGGPRAQTFLHVLLIVAVSFAFESLFIHHGIGWLFDEGWPIRTLPRQLPPALTGEAAVARQSIVSPGCVLQGRVAASVLSPEVRVAAGAEVEASVLMDGVAIGEEARIRRAIVDKHVRIPAGAVLGYDPEADRERFAVSADGVLVIPKGAQLD